MYLAIPAMLLCCAGPLIVGALGAGALATFWANGYGYVSIAILLLAGDAVPAWRLRQAGSAACCPSPARARSGSLGGGGRARGAPDAVATGRPGDGR